MKFRTNVCTVLAVALSICFATPLFAQTTGAPGGAGLEDQRDQDAKLDAILKQMPDDAERRIRDALTKADTQIDQAGIDLYTREWDRQILTSSSPNFSFDLEGNLVIATSNSQNQVSVEKYDITPTNGPVLVWVTQLPGNYLTRGLSIDIDGNIYLPLADASIASRSTYLAKISREGFVNWVRSYEGPDYSLSAKDMKCVLSPEGVPFLITSVFDVLTFEDQFFVSKIDPITGVQAFRSNLEDLIQNEISLSNMQIELDPAGRLYVLNSIASVDGSFLTRIDPDLGTLVWNISDPLKISADVSADNLEPRREGGVYISGSIGNNGVVYAIDPDGFVLDTRIITGDQDNRVIVNTVREFRDGSYTYGGAIVRPYEFPDFLRDSGFLAHVDPNAGTSWFEQVDDGFFDIPGTPQGSNFDGIVDIQYDRTGNIYCIYRSNTDSAFVPYQTNFRVHKFDRSGVEIWQGADENPSGNFDRANPVDLNIDGGGNVLATMVLTGDDPMQAAYLLKYSQPFLGVPTVQTASATLSFEDQSIWAPGMGNLVAEADLFEVDWNEDFSVDATFTVPVLGEFGGDFMFLTDGVLNTGVRAEVQGGTADVHFPIDIKFGIPPESKVSTGQQVSIAVDWDVDPAARLTSCFTPTFNAGLTAGVDYSVFSSLRLVAFSANLLNTEFVNDAAMIDRDYVPGVNLLDILADQGFLVPGEWASFEDPNGIVSADFRTPQMFAQGTYNPVTNSFSTTADDRFFRFGVSVTEAVLKAFGFTAQAEFEAGTIGGEFLVRGSGSALQLGARADLGAQQDIDVGLTPMITYDFVGNESIPSQTLPLGAPLNFTVPSGFDGVIEIVPTITATADFFNTTDIEMFPGITWDTIELAGAASAFGFDLVDFGPECIFCYDWDVSEILEALGAEPGLADFSINVFDDGWEIPVQSVTLPCIRVLGTSILENPPNIEAASRESLSMVIYDQTSPSVSSFNVATAGTSKMILYGERFASGSVGMIEHWGRSESLPTTYINPNTLLVEVPNRFRLLPGVAKLFVETTVKSKVVVSDTIDLAINFPVPRLDAVNPNLWAADPDLAVLPVSVIDAKSFAGNDTFITRRDYYIKMRDELWSDVTDDGFAGGAAEYFPGFDFNKIPEFPSVLWSSKGQTLPLPRFVQPVDNGIHNVRLGEDQYDIPMMVPVVICNPGPGGGMSNELMLTIAAPTPVTSSVIPSNFSPLDVILDENYFDPTDVPVERPIELRITGPNHVPQFSGYEEPKYGNFNAASVVRFNGLDLPTTFISSSLMIAQLPANLATLGDHSITVYTPSNGTQYFEELRVDANGDGIPDDVPAWQGLVDSGGESAPLLFRVRYRDPVIAEVLPSVIDLNSPAFDDSQFKEPRPYNLTLLGEDFREGAQVFFNGQLRDSEVVGTTKVKVKLLPQDVSMIGEYDIVVQNPFPQFEQSAPSIITVRNAGMKMP